MYEQPLFLHTAQVAAHELSEAHEATHLHALPQTSALAKSLEPLFSGEHAPQNFDVRLWTRILRSSYFQISEEEAVDPEKIYEKGKEAYTALRRVTSSTESATVTDIDLALKFCNGIDRGVRRHTTARRFGELAG